MTRAIWNKVVLADSDKAVRMRDDVFFPPESVKMNYLRESKSNCETCTWGGTFHYFDVVVGDEINNDAAWSYFATTEDSNHIRNWITFRRGIRIED